MLWAAAARGPRPVLPPRPVAVRDLAADSVIMIYKKEVNIVSLDFELSATEEGKMNLHTAAVSCLSILTSHVKFH